MTMQSERTLRFWDDYHEQKVEEEGGTHVHEWILRSSDSVMHQILVKCQPKHNILSVLEIGCGTSSLAKDLFEFCQANHRYQFDLDVLATDVSPVCIDHNKKRDNTKDLSKEDYVRQGEKPRFAYATLNVLEPSKEELLMLEKHYGSTFDLIVDKGCLDTFLFRSRHRGDTKNADNPLTRTILNNLRSWLRPASGRYFVISPRAKIKQLRDFGGFRCIEKLRLSSDNTEMTGLEGSKNQAECYAYVCSVNDEYRPKESLSERQHDQHSILDVDGCGKCQTTFREFRRMHSLTGKRMVRAWNAHKLHCKGNVN